MLAQPGETNCSHGIGHKKDIHGCDGCCLEVLEVETDFWTEAQELVVKIMKNDGGYTERQRTLSILADITTKHEGNKEILNVIGDIIERVVENPVGE